MIARNDKSLSETNLTTYRLNDLASFLDMFFSHFTSHFSRKRVAFTLAESATHVDTCDGKRKIAFTLAEVLITLGIIGVVASLTLPSVIQNYKKQVTVNQLKKAYSILGQVAQKAVADNGPVAFQAGSNVSVDDIKEFFNTYWLPYFKVAKVYPDSKCINLNDNKCLYKQMNNNMYTTWFFTKYDAGRIFFSTVDGMTFFVRVQTYKYTYDEDGNQVSAEDIYTSFQEVVVDVNGTKPPNTFGKDVFVFEIDFNNGVVRPYAYGTAHPYADTTCLSTGLTCATKIMRDGWKINY